MPSLKKMLQLYDLDLIGRISSFWGVESANLNLTSANKALCNAMKDAEMADEVIDSLSPIAREAWGYVAANPQKITWAQFTRKYGEVREFGPAKREREEPELHPVSHAEMLWYRGLIGRAFMNLPPEPREFVYIPDELVKFAKRDNSSSSLSVIESVPDHLINHKSIADSRMIDHMTDWLAARRMGRKISDSAWNCWHENETFLAGIALESKLVDEKGEPVTDALPAFFQQAREEILTNWFSAWTNSKKINDLKALPELVFEGNWQNDPVRPRQFLLELFHALKSDIWYSLASIVEAIKNNQPDFQRPAGDYDSWFIRKSGNEEYLRGFSYWDDVDGRLIRYFVLGPLHWLGLLDLGSTGEKDGIHYFRKTSLFTSFEAGSKSPSLQTKEFPISITPDLKFSVPLYASRTLRYQIARFCEIDFMTSNETVYKITPDSLKCAYESSLKISQLIHVLEKQLKSPLPKSLVLLAEQWEKTGLAAILETQTLLRTKSPDILQILQNDPHANKFLIELISPTVAIINAGGIKVIKKVLIEHGLLSEGNPDL